MLPGLLASFTQNFAMCGSGDWPSFSGLDVSPHCCHWSIYIEVPGGLFCSCHSILVYCFCLLEVKGRLYNYTIQCVRYHVIYYKEVGYSMCPYMRYSITQFLVMGSPLLSLVHLIVLSTIGLILLCTILTSVLRDIPHHFLHLSPLA